MARVPISFNKEEDLHSHWLTARLKSGKDFSFHSKFSHDAMNKDFFRICKDRTFDECKKELEEFLNLKYYKNPIFKMSVKNLRNAWKAVEKDFFNRMNNLMGVKFDIKIKGYLHTGIYGRASYKKRLFVISIRKHLLASIVDCGHEIMHLYFRRFYFKEIEKIVGMKKAMFLNESLTVLLNEEFKDLWIFNDKGYRSHEEFREFIARSWNEEKDFEVLMSKCIGYLIADK